MGTTWEDSNAVGHIIGDTLFLERGPIITNLILARSAIIN